MKTRLQQREAFLKRWEKQRKNKLRYAFLFGSLWAVPVWLISLVFRSSHEYTPFSLAVEILLTVISGFFFGLWLYSMSENRYREGIRQQAEDAELDKNDPYWNPSPQ